MHRERLEILRRRHVHVAKPVPQETQFEIPVHAARRAKHRTGGKPGDVVAVSEVRIVRDREYYLVRPLPENALRNLQLERGGEAGAKRDEAAVDPDMHLVAHALERQHRVAGLVQLDRATVVEAAVDVRERHVARAPRDRQALALEKRIDAKRVVHSGGAERLDHVLPIPGNGASYPYTRERWTFHGLVRMRPVRHLPLAVERDDVVDAVLEDRGFLRNVELARPLNCVA